MADVSYQINTCNCYTSLDSLNNSMSSHVSYTPPTPTPEHYKLSGLLCQSHSGCYNCRKDLLTKSQSINELSIVVIII